MISLVPGTDGFGTDLHRDFPSDLAMSRNATVSGAAAQPCYQSSRMEGPTCRTSANPLVSEIKMVPDQGYRLFFDPDRRCYRTVNGEFFIWPPI